ncbi:alpha/beta hydrolase [Antrihabitans sp. YC3-6]|uniref:Alpha/beta hydrolase n=1 Tax=Antrihabitans stalagmiti TaxID=2799499 RepID=A0A934U510_9NOCA|nr:alpha/beta hydrolase [Antrihabitans stalagmiti]MBJ8340966.1 alpha/beta hydrolase [Antrihabitans stalagmiti]
MRNLTLPRALVATLLRPVYRLTLNPRLSFATQRRLLDAGAPLQTLPSGTLVRELTLAGRRAEKITAGDDHRSAVLYLHGGGYTIGSIATHRSIAAHIARNAGVAVFVIDYRLAPENPFPAGLDDAEAAYLELIEAHGYTPEQVAIAGDSAGGGLALATARRLIDKHGVRPGALALIAPWVDPNVVSPRASDLVLTRRWSMSCAAAYLGDGDSTDPGYAPLLGSLAGLPPTLVHVGTTELLQPQAALLRDGLVAAGVEVEYTEYPTLWHCAQLQASMVEDAAAAVADLSLFLRTAFDRAAEEDVA